MSLSQRLISGTSRNPVLGKKVHPKRRFHRLPEAPEALATAEPENFTIVLARKKPGAQPGNHNRSRSLAIVPVAAPRGPVEYNLRPGDRALLDAFKRDQMYLEKSEHTLTHYVFATQKFLVFAAEQGLPDPRNVLWANIQTWVDSMRAAGLEPASVRHYVVGLQQFYKYLLRESEIAKSPFFDGEGVRRDLPKLKPTQKDVVDQDFVLALIQKLEEAKEWRDCALLAVLYDTGMRANELSCLRMEEVDLNEGTLKILKSKNGDERVVGLGSVALRIVRRYLTQPRTNPNFLINSQVHSGQIRRKNLEPGQLSVSGMYQAMKRMFRDAGLTATIGSHDMRHTSATHSAMRGDMTLKEFKLFFGWKTDRMADHYTKQADNYLALKAHQRHSPLDMLMSKRPRQLK